MTRIQDPNAGPVSSGPGPIREVETHQLRVAPFDIAQGERRDEE